MCQTCNFTDKFLRHAEERTPIEIITGENPYVNDYLGFIFFDWVGLDSNTGVGPS